MYSRTTSPLHRLHPSAKLLGLAIFFVPALAFNDPLWVLPIFCASVVLVGLARGTTAMQRIGPLALWLGFIAFALWSVLLRAGYRTHWCSIPVYPESILYGEGAGLRLVAIIMAGLALLASTRVEEIGEGLRRLGVPFRFCLTVALVFRLVPLFVEVSFRVREAQRARGYAPPAKTRFGTLRQFPPLLIPVLSYAMRRVDAMAMALEVRGISRTGLRTSYVWRPWLAGDAIAVGAMVILAAVCVWLRLQGYGAVLPRL